MPVGIATDHSGLELVRLPCNGLLVEETPKMIRNDSVASRFAELQALIEARLKGAEKIAQVIED
jgi:hypothetical protein